VPGKLANFTILADNPLTVDPMKIKDVRVWGTVHEGRVLPVKQSAEARAGANAPKAHVRPSATGSPADEALAQIFAGRLAELLAHRHGYGDDAH